MENNQTQKKDKKGLIILVLLLVAIVSTTFAVTFSRYITSTGATAEGTVAKWSIEIGNSGGTLNDITTQALNLSDCDWDNTHSTAEDGTIAPGSVCTFNLDIHNNSEVDAEIVVNVGEVTKDGNTIASGEYVPIRTEFTGEHVTNTAEGSTLSLIEDATETVQLKITWDDNANDADKSRDDTIVGKESAVSPLVYGVDVSIVARQKLN